MHTVDDIQHIPKMCVHIHNGMQSLHFGNKIMHFRHKVLTYYVVIYLQISKKKYYSVTCIHYSVHTVKKKLEMCVVADGSWEFKEQVMTNE